MTITTHDVKSIKLGEIEKLGSAGSYTRKIIIEGDEEIEITCFTRRKEDLEIEINERPI